MRIEPMEHGTLLIYIRQKNISRLSSRDSKLYVCNKGLKRIPETDRFSGGSWASNARIQQPSTNSPPGDLLRNKSRIVDHVRPTARVRARAICTDVQRYTCNTSEFARKAVCVRARNLIGEIRQISWRRQRESGVDVRLVGRVAAGIDPGFTDLSQPPSPATRRPLPILPPSLRAGGRSSSLRQPPPSDANSPYRIRLRSLFHAVSRSLSLSIFRSLSLANSLRLVPFFFPSRSFCHPALTAAALNATSCPQPRPQPQIARACQIAVHHGSLCRLQIDSQRCSDIIYFGHRLVKLHLQISQVIYTKDM